MTTETTRAGLDNRVTDDDGQPAAERRFMRWFRIRRDGDHPGVNLVTRIPGYLEEVTPHPDQDAAMRAARAIYTGYRDAVRALSGQPEHQED